MAGKGGRDVRYLAQAMEKEKKVLLPGGGVGRAPTSGSDSLLEPIEVAQLLEVATVAPERFPLLRGDDGTPRPADVEFAVRNGRITLLQIRPFNESQSARNSQYLRSLDARIADDGGRRVALDAAPRE